MATSAALRFSLVLPLALLAAAACGADDPAAQADLGSAPSHVSAAELLEMIDDGVAPTIVDVRTRSEYESGHVPGAIHIPFWAALGRADQIPSAPDRLVVVYCEHGPRAGAAKAAFRAKGFEHIAYLEGHMSGWKQAGLRMETEAPEP